MAPTPADAPPGMNRSFLVLQTIATPFFSRLGVALLERGHRVSKVAFCGGDLAFWQATPSLAYRGTAEEWPAALARLMAEREVTDLILFGDQRPLHKAALPVAEARGARVHVFEEAYLRPGWIGLERSGTNSASPLPRDPAEIRARAAGLPPVEFRDVPASFLLRASWDVAYSFWSGWMARSFPHYRSHRLWSPWREYAGWALRGLKRPLRRRASVALTRALRAGPPYWLLPLQLEGDFQLRAHSPYRGMREAIAEVFASFARHARPEERLAVKGHPLDNGVIGWGRVVAEEAARHGIAGRVFYLPEAVYGRLLEAAQGVVTVNSTAGLHAVGAGKPVKTLGEAVYDMPGLTFQGSLDAFWRAAGPPDLALFDAFRRVLAAEAMVRGGYFHPAAIEEAVRNAIPRLLAP
ncbi:MAG: capsular biosynthesis protein [Acetobacteraceae bacterium]|nr:capsular biosynthesis protein [Acetobacteraceae bacterium]